MKNFLPVVILFLFVHITYSQDFTEIDNYARSVKYTRDLAKLTDKLTSPYSDDLSKVRAIFTCLVTNIEYDHKKLEKMKDARYKTEKFHGSKEEFMKYRLEQIQEYIKETLEDKKGVCQDYAYLFQAMCLHAGIECEFVTGAGKNNPSYIGKANMPERHAWNAVKIEDKWALVDVTWSTGMGVKEDFGNGFFNLPPQTMIMSHYPSDQKWQLLDTIVSKQFFADLPFLNPGFIKYGVSDIHPFSGKIKPKQSISCRANLPAGSQLAIYKNRVFQKIPVMSDGERYHFDMSEKAIYGMIDVCIMLPNGRVEPLYSLKVTDQ
jgi:transglutaminase/protease-like cytokinesis protein 3